jgi:hypothetical protein
VAHDGDAWRSDTNGNDYRGSTHANHEIRAWQYKSK